MTLTFLGAEDSYEYIGRTNLCYRGINEEQRDILNLFFDTDVYEDVLRQSKVSILDEEDCLEVMVYEGVQQFVPVDEFCVGSLTGFIGACYVSNSCIINTPNNGSRW